MLAPPPIVFDSVGMNNINPFPTSSAATKAYKAALAESRNSLTQAQLDKAMSDHAGTIDDAKVTRADGTIDGSKLIDEMFGR